MASRSERPICHQCASFWITYAERHPYGCRAFEMKSKALPSHAVREASGKECRAFVRKEIPKPHPKRGLHG